ncbi:MAG: 30S ribosome-binding factor RbfA [Clostridiales bacterium]|nr:30S ribosome-binding factor RbfA [Clostridiales bacterium]
MKNNRLVRVNDEIKREVAAIFLTELSDPRIRGGVVSVTNVETTPDLKFCKIFISSLGTDEEKKAALDGAVSATGYVRKQIAAKLNLRLTPAITFVADDSIEHGARISKLIDEAVADIKNSSN